jgi:large subunit ribosomal protein L11
LCPKPLHLSDDVPLPVSITAFNDKSYEFETKYPPVGFFLKRAAGVEEGADQPGHDARAAVTLMHVYEIAWLKQKQRDLEDVPLHKICKQILGTCKSLGIDVLSYEQVIQRRRDAGLDNPPSSDE